jgi:pilus assembly protein Flp/PilA
MKFISAFIREEDGVTAIEYGLIAALVAVAIVVGAGNLGIQLNGIFQRLANCMADTSTCNLVA